MKKYDYLIVGTGLFGAVFAHEMTKAGKHCVAIDRRNHIGGNIFTYELEGIQVHKYGAHIFHTSNKEVWNYINEFTEFNQYINSPVARYEDEVYNLPFNMNTFHALWGVKTPKEAKAMIDSQIKDLHIENPSNLEEQALSLVGTDVYEKLIKGYTQKQWGRECKDLPSFIINRLPLRFTYDNNYFKDRYQGIPIGGYTRIIEQLFEGTDILLNTEYYDFIKENQMEDSKIIYTGMIDEYYKYQFGPLEYRTVSFDTEVLDDENFQGNAVVNYTQGDIPYTRIIEHKHFEYGTQPKTVISKEYPTEWVLGMEPYYPINDEKNMQTFQKYEELAQREQQIYFGGRLGGYKYYDMDKTIEAALVLSQQLSNK